MSFIGDALTLRRSLASPTALQVGYPATVSSAAGAAAVLRAAERVVGASAVVAPSPTLAGEDMARTSTPLVRRCP